MDAWRSLIDYNIYAGLLPAAGAAGLSIKADSFAMWRRRQHAAHEIGHTLGFPHNYIAGSQGRTSVMAYPFPLISLDSRHSMPPFALKWVSGLKKRFRRLLWQTRIG